MKKNHFGLPAVLILFLMFSCHPGMEDFTEARRLPSLFPDYTGIVIPPNIAPLNFEIMEPGSEYMVCLYTNKEKPLTIKSKDPSVRINPGRWRRLLQQAKGSKLFADVYVKSPGGKWHRFQPVINEIAREEIDSHLAYRLINAGYVLWNNLGIYQRNLESFDEKPILENKSIGHGCLNCHSFSNNNPDQMMFHVRAINSGTVINRNGQLTKVDTKTQYTLSAGAYPCWHPNGKHIAFSVNNIGQNFCAGEVRIEVSDLYSDIIVYDIERNRVTTCPAVSTASRENLPVWSPDGKYLYYISAPPATGQDDRIHTQYDLLRIPFDVNQNAWGTVDTVLSHKKTGQSISFPKISPDGRYLMFCTSENGYFTIHHPGSDLNLLDLQTGEFHKMEINSPQTESYHSFSSNGRWFVFSSKRLDGLYARPYFSYLDKNGKASKPFVLPQKDPRFYHSFLKNYNIPELITGAVTVSPLKIRETILRDAVPVKLAPDVDTTYMKKHLAGMAK